MALGLYRTKSGWANQDSVRVRYSDGREIDVPEDEYRASDYLPNFDDLPWAEDAALGGTL